MTGGFLRLVSMHDDWYVCTTRYGATTLVSSVVAGPAATAASLGPYVESGVVVSFERAAGWGARFSADGYLEATDWCGPYPTQKAAERACMEEHNLCRHGYDRDDYHCVGGTHPERK